MEIFYCIAGAPATSSSFNLYDQNPIKFNEIPSSDGSRIHPCSLRISMYSKVLKPFIESTLNNGCIRK